MRVCMISASFPPHHCGVGDYTYHLSRALAGRGIDLQIISSSDIHCDMDGLLPVIDKWDFRGTQEVCRRVREISPDIIHFQFPSAPMKGELAPMFLPLMLRRSIKNASVVTTLHEYSLAPPRSRIRQQLMAAASAAVIVPDAYDGNLLCKPLNGMSAKLNVIGVGCNVDISDSGVDVSDEWNSGDAKLLFFGKINPLKGLDSAIDAVSILSSRGKSAHLLAIGDIPDTDSPERAHYEYLLDKVKSLDIENKVTFTGRKPSNAEYEATVGSYMRAADVCVLPFEDGATLRRGSLAACFAFGKATVTSASKRTSRDLIRDGENCLLVPPSNPPAIADAIGRILDDPKLRSKLENGAAELAQEFSWDRIAERTIQVYQRTNGRLGISGEWRVES